MGEVNWGGLEKNMDTLIITGYLGSMTIRPDQLNHILTYLGWSSRDAARFFDYSHSAVNNWRWGKCPMPTHLAQDLVDVYNREHEMRVRDPSRPVPTLKKGGRPRNYDC